MKNKLVLLIISIILTISAFICTLAFSCSKVAFGIFSGIFGSSLCFFVTTIIDYFIERKRALINYLDFVIHFRKNIRKIKLCSEEPEKALEGILSLDGNELLYYNRKYYNWLNSKDKEIRAIYNTINVFAEAIANYNIAWNKNKDKNQTISELLEFDNIFFYKDGDVVKSFLDHQDFISFVNSLNNKVNDSCSLDFIKVAYYYVNKECKLDNLVPWNFPDSKSKKC